MNETYRGMRFLSLLTRYLSLPSAAALRSHPISHNRQSSREKGDRYKRHPQMRPQSVADFPRIPYTKRNPFLDCGLFAELLLAARTRIIRCCLFF